VVWFSDLPRGLLSPSVLTALMSTLWIETLPNRQSCEAGCCAGVLLVVGLTRGTGLLGCSPEERPLR
jgi:hypothetical protein